MQPKAGWRWLAGGAVVAGALLLAAGAGLAQEDEVRPESGEEGVVCVDGTPISELLGTPEDGLLGTPEGLFGTPEASPGASPAASPVVCATPGAGDVEPGETEDEAQDEADDATPAS